jgi:hypothetical protein
MQCNIIKQECKTYLLGKNNNAILLRATGISAGAARARDGSCYGKIVFV